MDPQPDQGETYHLGYDRQLEAIVASEIPTRRASTELRAIHFETVGVVLNTNPVEKATKTNGLKTVALAPTAAFAGYHRCPASDPLPKRESTPDPSEPAARRADRAYVAAHLLAARPGIETLLS